jgi:hypothetical protein
MHTLANKPTPTTGGYRRGKRLIMLCPSEVMAMTVAGGWS